MTVASSKDGFGTRATLTVGNRSLSFHRLRGFAADDLPRSLRILLENVLRHQDGTTTAQIEALRDWRVGNQQVVEVRPTRVFLHDTNGVPALVDLASMRDAMADLGGDPGRVNPLVPAELVVDHSVIADVFGRPDALQRNVELEYKRNAERYRFLRWGQQALSQLRVVPPGTGIMHQVNLEYLARVVEEQEGWAFPDFCLGTDSHTTMVNGLGVLGWGIGGIEAEAAMLGQSISMLIPPVVGVRLTGTLQPGTTATDLVLTITETLRAHGVVGKLVEFHGPGLAALAVPDRATIANMSPEFGSTAALFPIDEQTLNYLRFTGRDEDRVALVETYAKEQGLWHEPEVPLVFTELLEIDLAAVVPSIAGPRRPQERTPLSLAKNAVRSELPPEQRVPVTIDGRWHEIGHGAVAVAAITSCTNTSNPSVMVAAALLARNAVEKGLTTRPWVKTTLSPGSRVVMDYYAEAGLTPYLEKLGFHLAGFGCMTCIGASGSLIGEVSEAVREHGLSVAAVLSGNRNFEGRIQPDVRLNYLASPPLVVAYALAGRMDLDLLTEPLGTGTDGLPVYLRDLWPTPAEVEAVIGSALRPEMFTRAYADVFGGDERWRSLAVPGGETFDWDEGSTYLQKPPYLENLAPEPRPHGDLHNACVLVRLGDSVTTDHLSPAGAIPPDSIAGRYLRARGVPRHELNTYASRRGNHLVMMRGAFGNTRLQNLLAPGIDGAVTRGPDGALTSIYDAAVAYREAGVPVVVVAGRDYGVGSSRDWAAKGPALLGVRAVLAQSFERIHRSNLVGMGVLPLEFLPGEGDDLTGEDPIDITGLEDGFAQVSSGDRTYRMRVRLDTPREHDYYRHGGVLPYVLCRLSAGGS
jgi:aconitate hydratase